MVLRGNSQYHSIKNHSAKIIAGYVYANAGEGESTTDYVYEAQNIIAEKGRVLAQAERFINEILEERGTRKCQSKSH